MQLTLVRHGDAHAGFHGAIGGETGCRGLTDLGRSQAEQLRERLAVDETIRPDVMITSRIPRAIETAGIVGSALGMSDIERDCGWCEVHTGDADGVDWADYPTTFGSFDMTAEPDRVFAPNGDSWNSFHERVDEMMTTTAVRWPGQNVMVVCHAGVIAATLRVRFGRRDGSGVRLTPTHTGLTRWSFVPDTSEWTLRYYDDSAHLVD